MLYNQKVPPGVIFTANCDVNLWNQNCQRFDVGRSVYHHFFSQVCTASGAGRGRMPRQTGERQGKPKDVVRASGRADCL